MAEPRIQYAKTSDGVSVAYWTMGGGKPLIAPGNASTPSLLNSVGAAREWLERLARDKWLISFDHRGVGMSDRDAIDFSAQAQAIDLLAVVDDLKLNRFAVFGGMDSGPGMIALAAAHPDRVSHLILYNTYARWSDLKFPPEMRGIGALLVENWELYTETLSRVALGWDGDLGRDWAKTWREAVPHETYLEALAQIRQFDVTSLLRRVTCPTLVVHRRGLPYLEVASARHLAAEIPNARLLLLEGRLPATFDVVEPLGDAVDEFLGIPARQTVSKPVSAAVPSGTATILFTDLTSSTALTQRLGDAKAQELVRAHNAIVREALGANGGTEIKHTGDGIMASFPTASGALECAVAIQQAVAGRADANLQVHIGLNAGEPVAEESDLFGTSVQLARRICDHAESGQILASNVVRELAAGKGFLFADIGEVVPKGFEEPVRLYEVRWRE